MSILIPQIATPTGGDPASGQATVIVQPIFGGHIESAEVIVNADDWGRDRVVTNRTLDCFRAGAISSVSAMVFMTDSERAAELARTNRIDAGLHLNFTTRFSAKSSLCMFEHHQKIVASLTHYRFSAAFYHPRLAASFEYVAKAQIEEYERLYGASPMRFDGDRQMHLCANVLGQNLIPAGAIVRRNLACRQGSKYSFTRLLRSMKDARLARRYRVADYFFDLHPTEPTARLRSILDLGTRFNVEIETHPFFDEEYRFLMDGEFKRCRQEVKVARGYVLRSHLASRSQESLA